MHCGGDKDSNICNDSSCDRIRYCGPVYRHCVYKKCYRVYSDDCDSKNNSYSSSHSKKKSQYPKKKTHHSKKYSCPKKECSSSSESFKSNCKPRPKKECSSSSESFKSNCKPCPKKEKSSSSESNCKPCPKKESSNSSESDIELGRCRNRNKCRIRGADLIYRATRLVSNLPTVALHQDPQLINAWGIAIDNDTLWVAAEGTGVIKNYTLEGVLIGTVTLPVPLGEDPARPTGLIINPSTGFVIESVPNSAASLLLVATENGYIYGYNPLVNATAAVLAVDNSASGSIYKGLAVLNDLLYVADFFNRRIDVFDSNFTPVAGILFSDPTIPTTFAPFNIVAIGDLLYVLYAKQLAPGNEDDEPGAGNGYINIFTPQGILVRRFVSNGRLNSPWALITVPKIFPSTDSIFLVGNVGDGHINAYNANGIFLGDLKNRAGTTIVLDGLHGLVKGDDDSIYWASGPDDETNGLVGVLTKFKCS